MKSIPLFVLLVLSTSNAFAASDSVYAIVRGDSATVWDKNVVAQCASKFAMDVAVSHDTIAVVERDTSSIHAKCECLFDVSVTIVNLSGQYTVMVYRQELKIYGYPIDTTYFIGSTSFTNTNISLLPYFSIKQYQSACGGVPVIIEQRGATIPERIQIANFPNPFNPATNLRFTITDLRFVDLRVYDVLGREVATLLEKSLNPGEYTVHWDATNFPSGIYFYRWSAGGQRQIGKMNLAK